MAEAQPEDLFLLCPGPLGSGLEGRGRSPGSNSGQWRSPILER
ncbi:hypothetical protein [Geitlerinema sp. PCC 7407]|nr:hypothetical protein [Geitlerinema sp. PCC 7407]